MSLKDTVAAALLDRRGEFVSGGELAARAGVSRNAVCKAVDRLISEGYPVTAVRGRGYCLAEKGDILSPLVINRRLKNPEKFTVTVADEADSTNNVLRAAAESGAAEGSVFIARRQTAGKGRTGRRFFSPDGSGLYLSLLLRPKLAPTDSLLITAAAAVAAARAIEETSGREAGIKWVNDIYLDDKKVCGILTEAAISVENGGLEYAVLGVGINAVKPKGGFPKELSSVAAYVTDGEITDIRSALAAAFLDDFWEYYTSLPERGFIEEYKRRSILTGRRISVISGGSSRPALALGVTDDCRLKVRYDDGTEEELFSGEVSTRLEN